MHRFGISLLAAVITILSTIGLAFAQPSGPSGYLCFDADSAPFGCGMAESPFADVGRSGGYFFLEDFEDGLLDTPGVNADRGQVMFLGGDVDSVDEDDGVIDGSGILGASYSAGYDATQNAAFVTFTFDPAILGTLPTHAGLVWTDGLNDVIFEAFGPGMVSLGTIGPVSIADASFNGDTAEDAFFGWIDEGGILAIRMTAGSPGNVADLEVDHLQYGHPNASGPSSYLCFDANSSPLGCGDAESPFAGLDFSGGYFNLEDFEGGSFDNPGVSADRGQFLVSGSKVDSVDEDDGAIDGSGSSGDSYFANHDPIQNTAFVTFTFDPAILGRLPTHAGLVWTDGLDDVTFEAFGPGMVSIGTIGPVSIAGATFRGDTAEDTFFGWNDEGGILAIRMTTGIPGTVTGIEVDHLQYGFAPPNAAPTAVAGSDQSIRAGDTIFLDGTGSFDDNTPMPDLSYAWGFVDLPLGSTASLTVGDSAIPSFVADIAGTYTVQLIVVDSAGLSSAADEVVVSSENLAPTAVAGNDRLAIVDEPVFLDGSLSSDPEGDAMTFAWAITSAPPGSIAILGGDNTDMPSLIPDLEGVYELTLTVSDLLGPGAPDRVNITATTAEGLAEEQIVVAADIVSGLFPELGEVTTEGNQNAFAKFLRQAMKAIQRGRFAKAVKKLEKAIVRTDGCVLRGAPDRKRRRRDWILDCDVQFEVYDLLSSALDGLKSEMSSNEKGRKDSQKQKKKKKKKNRKNKK